MGFDLGFDCGFDGIFWARGVEAGGFLEPIRPSQFKDRIPPREPDMENGVFFIFFERRRNRSEKPLWPGDRSGRHGGSKQGIGSAGAGRENSGMRTTENTEHTEIQGVGVVMGRARWEGCPSPQCLHFPCIRCIPWFAIFPSRGSHWCLSDRNQGLLFQPAQRLITIYSPY